MKYIIFFGALIWSTATYSQNMVSGHLGKWLQENNPPAIAFAQALADQQDDDDHDDDDDDDDDDQDDVDHDDDDD